jgi:hypothetical protein
VKGAGAAVGGGEAAETSTNGPKDKAKLELELELKKQEVELKRLELEETRVKAEAEAEKMKREKEREERASVVSAAGFNAEMNSALAAHEGGEGEWKGRSSTIAALEHSPFAEGQIVDANYRGLGRWERGVVTAARSAGYAADGTPEHVFDIAFLALSSAGGSVDEVEENVPDLRLRPVEDAQAYHAVTEEVDICIGKFQYKSQYTHGTTSSAVSWTISASNSTSPAHHRSTLVITSLTLAASILCRSRRSAALFLLQQEHWAVGLEFAGGGDTDCNLADIRLDSSATTTAGVQCTAASIVQATAATGAVDG